MSDRNEEQNNSPDEEMEDSFRNMNLKGKIATVIGIALLIVLVIGFVFGLYFFGLAGVFKLLGVQYESTWSLVVFVVGVFILGIIVELFSKLIFMLLTRNIIGKIQLILTRFFIEAASNWLVLFTVDEFMDSITLSLQTELIIGLLLAVAEIVFDDDKEKK